MDQLVTALRLEIADKTNAHILSLIGITGLLHSYEQNCDFLNIRNFDNFYTNGYKKETKKRKEKKSWNIVITRPLTYKLVFAIRWTCLFAW